PAQFEQTLLDLHPDGVDLISIHAYLGPGSDVSPDRFGDPDLAGAATVARLQAREQLPDAAELGALLERLGALPRQAGAPEPLTWLTASAGRETRLVLVDDVAYFQAEHKYTTVVTADGEALLRSSLRELLPRLDPNTFKQIHRSTIVNLKAIAGIVRDDSGRGTVRLKQRAETLTVSQPFMALFKHM
ncbi:MAG TPA: LytTR family DNA-binding domain-containing protein, partial [Thermomonas sp.]|nr:LytTR family DNA-binding domain-containing protein [Thermomonas sp.]